jgi:hypothetical protein
MFEIYLEALINVERELWPDEKLGACKGEQINEPNPVIKFFPFDRVRCVQGEEQQRLMLC